MSTIGSIEESVRVTPGGHEYDFITCGCVLRLERCPRCYVDYTEMNEDALREALEQDKRNCSNLECHEKGKLTCSACKLVCYCSPECQKSDWRRHKPVCKKARNDGSKTIRINIACAPNPDEFVDAYPIGTRLTLSMGRRENPRCKIVAFNLGKGPYADPKVKFDHKKYPGMWDESLCSYTVKYADGELSTQSCQEFHQQGWTVISGSDDDGESSTVVGNASAAASAAESAAIEVTIPSVRKVLLVTGFLLDKNDCFWCQKLSTHLRTLNIPSEILDVSDGREQLIAKLTSGQFTACVIIGVGSSGAGCMSTYFLGDVKAVLKAWVNAGGKLALQGEGCLADLFNSCFGKSWFFANYERQINTISRSSACDVPQSERDRLPKQFSVKACCLENVEESSRLYAYEDGRFCTVAVSKIGAGRLTFIGDVNAEDAVIVVILGMETLDF